MHTLLRLKRSTTWQLGVIIIIASLLSPTSRVTAQADLQTRPQRPPVHKLTLQGVPQLIEVTPRLYRGGQPSEEGFRSLAKMGIGIVVDLRGSREHERQLVNSLGMEYVPMPWHCPFPKDEIFARFLSLLRENPEKKVFLHCRLGDDRSGMMIAAFRMAEQGWTAEQAKQEMKASGFGSSHHLICPGLSRYATHFPERYQTSPAFKDLR